MTYKYRAKKPFAVIYVILICIGVLLTLGRWLSVFNQEFVVISSSVHSHISNFSLSMIAYLGIGYSWLLFGKKLSLISMVGVLFIVGNFICETLMGFMNTTDIIDAVYGTAGVMAAYVYLFFTCRYGLIKA